MSKIVKLNRKRNASPKQDQSPAENAPAPQAIAVAKPYEPTKREQAALDAFAARRRAMKPAPRLTVSTKGNTASKVEHPDAEVGGTLILESLGLSDSESFQGLMGQIVNAAIQGQKVDQDKVNSMLSMVQGIQPRDTVEAMLAAQMVAVHNATMTFARRLNHVDNIPQQDSASNAFNKLARTFAAQTEALNRYRGKGQQAIRVEHVTVNGGQAIVGSQVTHQGGGVTTNSEDLAHAKQITHAPGTPMPGQNPQREAVPITEGQSTPTMQDARLRQG